MLMFGDFLVLIYGGAVRRGEEVEDWKFELEDVWLWGQVDGAVMKFELAADAGLVMGRNFIGFTVLNIWRRG